MLTKRRFRKEYPLLIAAINGDVEKVTKYNINDRNMSRHIDSFFHTTKLLAGEGNEIEFLLLALQNSKEWKCYLSALKQVIQPESKGLPDSTMTSLSFYYNNLKPTECSRF